MSTPLDILKKGLLQQQRLSLISPKKKDELICHPNPKRFDYRVELLKERYLVSIQAMDPDDIIHEFLYIPPNTPPNTVKGPSTSPTLLSIPSPTAFSKPSSPGDLVVHDPPKDVQATCEKEPI
jgi:hypothetical protein